MQNRSDPKLLIGILLMLLGLTVRYGATLHNVLMRIPAGNMVWVLLFVGGFCCTGLYLFEKMMKPVTDGPALICPACRQTLQPPSFSQSICPACGEFITVSDPSIRPADRASTFSRLPQDESFWGSRQSVPLILPLYLFLMALAVYLAEHPDIVSQWYDIFKSALFR